MRNACEHTLRVFSMSPQGSLLTKSMPVRGVPVGGSNIEASIIRYSTFSGLLCNINMCTGADKHMYNSTRALATTIVGLYRKLR